MKKKEESKLKEEFKISKNSSRIPNRARDLEKAVAILRKGQVVVFPTDTVYGIGSRFDMPQAVARIKNIKRTSQDFPILISNMDQAHQLAKFDSQAQHLANRYWPGALTIILQSKTKPDKIGLRIPDSKLVREIIDKIGIPIIGTSANFHGQKPPKTFKEIDKRLIEKVDYVLKGRCKLGDESTVVDATLVPFKLIRQGAVKIR